MLFDPLPAFSICSSSACGPLFWWIDLWPSGSGSCLPFWSMFVRGDFAVRLFFFAWVSFSSPQLVPTLVFPLVPLGGGADDLWFIFPQFCCTMGNRVPPACSSRPVPTSLVIMGLLFLHTKSLQARLTSFRVRALGNSPPPRLVPLPVPPLPLCFDWFFLMSAPLCLC